MSELNVEVIRGEFDPREYKKLDRENWAKKRRSDWMATTGKIHFVRERTRASEERERTEASEEREITESELKEGETPKPDDVQPNMNSTVDVDQKPKTEFWPRKKRSDITQRYI